MNAPTRLMQRAYAPTRLRNERAYAPTRLRIGRAYAPTHCDAPDARA